MSDRSSFGSSCHDIISPSFIAFDSCDCVSPCLSLFFLFLLGCCTLAYLPRTLNNSITKGTTYLGTYRYLPTHHSYPLPLLPIRGSDPSIHPNPHNNHILFYNIHTTHTPTTYLLPTYVKYYTTTTTPTHYAPRRNGYLSHPSIKDLTTYLPYLSIYLPIYLPIDLSTPIARLNPPIPGVRTAR